MILGQESERKHIILVGHGNIGTAFANEIVRTHGYGVSAIFGKTGSGILIPNIDSSQRFFAMGKVAQRESLSDSLVLMNLAQELGPDRVIIVDASSNPHPDAHTELFRRGFRIVSANKNPLGLGDAATAMEMLASSRYGGEPTVMAGQGVLNFIGTERSNPYRTGPIESILQIDLIGSGTLSGIAEDLSQGVEYSEAVKRAIKRGDTEPNPNDDMDGMDLAKKLVILARKTGYNVSINNVQFGDGFLDSSFRTEFEGQDWGDKNRETDAQRGFVKKIGTEKDAYMKDLIERNKPKVPRYIGRMVRKNDGTVDLSVGIEFVSIDSEHCAAKFNKAIITVDRGGGAPLDIKTISGRGAGPIQTAQGMIHNGINLILKNGFNS